MMCSLIIKVQSFIYFLRQNFQFLLMIAEEGSQIIDLSGLTNQQILGSIERMLEENSMEKFTVVLKRIPKSSQLPDHQQDIQFSIKPIQKHKKYSMSIDSTYLAKSIVETIGKQNEPMALTQKILSQRQEVNSLLQALRLYEHAHYQRAIELFKQLEKEATEEDIKTGKDYKIISFHIGSCYYRLKNYEMAIKYFESRLGNEDLKQQGQKYNNLGSCYAALKQHRLSLKNYAQALKIYSQFPEIDCSNLLNNLGMLYTKSGMHETAEKYFAQSIVERQAKSPQNSQMLLFSYQALGKCQKEAGKYSEAISSLLLALNFAERGFGDYGQTLKLLALLYQLNEKWGEALSYYQKLSDYYVSKGISMSFIYERVSIIYGKLGNHSECNKFIELAYQSYKIQGDQRKLSQLSPAVQRIKGTKQTSL